MADRLSSGRRQIVLQGLGLALLLALIAGVGLAFAGPWLPRPAAGGSTLARYAPVRDGDARLMARFGPDGRLLGWESQNRAVVSWLRLYVDIGPGLTNPLMGFYGVGRSGQPFQTTLRALQASSQIMQVRVRQLDLDGQQVNSASVFARDERGEFLIGFELADQHRVVALDPPIQTLPADLGPGRVWDGEGSSPIGQYRWNGRVLDSGALDTPAGGRDDCLLIETRVVWAQGGQAGPPTTWQEWLCEGIGLVRSQELDAAGSPTTLSVTVAADELPTAAAFLPPSQPMAAEPVELADPAGWELARVGRARRGSDVAVGTIPPLWVPGAPPLLLAAGYGGDLYAFNAESTDGSPIWRFHPEGTIYGEPAVDPQSGRIYFGASDKRLYALDRRGLFLWSFATEDNVAGRPVIHDGMVVFGSEDRVVYGLDAATGARRWSYATEGAIISSPALLLPAGRPDEAVVVIGSDDSVIYAFDPASGARRWSAATNGAIEAPIVVADDVVYAASRDGSVTAVDPADCDDECEPSWSTKAGGALRTAPAVGAELVFVVDEDGYLIALERESGRRRWSTVEQGYVGPPVATADAIVVARRDGRVVRLNLEGVEQDAWSAAEASGPNDAKPGFQLGPSVGGGALWLADDNAVVRRLGPPPAGGGPAPLRPAWLLAVGQPPLADDSLFFTPVEHGGRALVRDFEGRIHVLDPESGQGTYFEGPGSGVELVHVDPVVAGGALLVGAGETLHALELPSGTPRWQHAAPGEVLQPPIVVGDTVVWMVGPAPPGGTGTLLALDLATGAVRWEVPLGGFVRVGGAAADGETVYTSTPPAAYDLKTGGQRWQAEVAGVALGGPALSAGGEVLYVAASDPGAAGAAVVALDTADGRPRWRSDLKAESPRSFERLWLSDGTLVVPIGAGSVIGLDAATGAERWRYQPPALRLGSLAVLDGLVWMVLENGFVVALDAQQGEPVARLTSLDQPLAGQGLTQRPARVGDRMLFALGRWLLAVELPERGR